MRRVTGSVVAFLFAFGMFVGASGQYPGTRSSPLPAATGTSSQPVSNSTILTWFARIDEDVRQLQLLVLWRGTPRWYLQGSSSGSGGGSASSFHSTARYGEVDLQVDFDTKTRVAHVQGIRVELHDDNVILVDDVAGPGRPKVAGTRRIDLSLPQPDGVSPSVGVVLRRSPELLSFVGCDAAPSGAKAPATPDRWCEQLRIK
jgi:hypothetical protein